MARRTPARRDRRPAHRGQDGVGRLLPTSVWSALPEPAAGQVRAFAAGPRPWRTIRDEASTLPALLRQACGLMTLGSVPLVVLTASGHDGDAAWTAAQQRMTDLSSAGRHRFADASTPAC
jgi:hypothetical protein